MTDDEFECVRCRAITDYEGSGLDIQSTIWNQCIFNGRHKPDVGTFCKPCAVIVTPLIYRLRDISEVSLFNNKLLKAINEKRKPIKDNRPTSVDACECSQGSSQWGFGHRPSDGTTQVGEEHF